MKYLAKITSKGQITIPQEIRKRLGLKQGDQISFEYHDGKIFVKPYRSEENPFLAYQGRHKGFETLEDINNWIAEMRDE